MEPVKFEETVYMCTVLVQVHATEYSLTNGILDPLDLEDNVLRIRFKLGSNY